MIDEVLKNEMRRLLNLGIYAIQIQSILRIDNDTYNAILDELKEKIKITQEKIIEARAKRDEESKNIVYDMYVHGYIWRDMVEKIPYSSKSYIEGIMDKLKTEGRITDEVAKIAEEAKRKREKAKKEEQTEKSEEPKETKEPYQDKILSLFLLGCTGKEIEKITKLSKRYIGKIKKILIENGDTTLAEIKQKIKDREPNAKKRRRALSGMVTYEKDIDIQTVQDHIEYARIKNDLEELDPKDIDLISMAIPMDHNLMTLSNINFVIKHYNDAECLEFAVDFINRCLESARDSQEKRRLTEMKEKIERKMQAQKESRYNQRDKWVSESIKANPRIVVKLPEEPTQMPEIEQEER